MNKEKIALRAENGPTKTTANRLKVELARAGRTRTMTGASSTIISKDAIRNAIENGLFNNLASFCDHPDLWSGYSLKHIAGIVRSATWNEDEGIATGEIELYDTQTGKMIAELFSDTANSPDIGTSLVFFGTTEPSGEDKKITSIDNLFSIDFVFMPAAMTRVLEKLSAMNAQEKPASTHATQVKQMVDDELKKEVQMLKAQIAELSADKAINTPPQPTATQKQFILSGQRITTTTPEEMLTASVNSFFGLETKGVTTFNVELGSLYRDLTGDINMNGQWNIDTARKITGLSTITEETFGDLMCGCMNNAIEQKWQQLSESYLWWKQIAKPVKRNNFTKSSTNTGINFTGMRDLEPGEAIPQATVRNSTKEGLSKWHFPAMMITMPIQHLENAEECANFQIQPEDLATDAIVKISNDFIELLCGNNGRGAILTDGDYLFSSRRGNLRTGGAHAISYPSWAEAWGDMMSIKTANGNELAQEPYGIVTSSQNTVRAIQVTTGSAQADTADNNINPIPVGRKRVVTAPNWTGLYDWMTFTNPNTMPALKFGYRYSEMPRIVPEPNGANSYGIFTTRSLRWKVEHFYEIVLVNPRGLQKRIVG